MSIYKSSTLAMIPTAYKDGKLYSVRPTDGSGDFTFSRGSNLAATRVASSGYIEKGRENLLLQSNTFDTTWFLNRTSATSGQSGYDGSNDAWLLEADVAGSLCNVNQSVSISGVMTASIYAKEGTTNWFRFSVNDSGVNTRAWFDLSGSGAVGTTAGNIIDAKIESVDNGYFRCSITFNATATNLLLFVTNADNSVSYSVGDNIYIQDAQLEAGLVATDYIETTTTSASAGILEDMPRLDYSGSCPALLLEPQRTNNITQSEYFGAWSTLNSSVTNNSATSPEGVTNAALCEYSITSSNGYIRLAHTAAQTISFYIKYKDVQWVMVYLSGLGAGKFIDIQNGVVGGNVGSGATAEIVDAGNDWKRVILKSSSANITQTSIYAAASDGSYASITLSGGIYLYGAQAEAGSYPTSYIPTYGASVTRSLDQCELFGMNAAGISTSNNWTYFIDVDNFESGQEAFYLRSTSAELMHLYHQSLGYRNSSNSSSYPASWSWSSYSGNNSQVKMCIRYDGSQLSVFINGSKKSDVIDSSSLNTSFNYPFDQDKFHFAGNSKWDTNQKAFYDTALTDSECIALTTL